MKVEIADWEKYLKELNDLEEKYLADREAIKNRFSNEQRARRKEI